MNFDWTLLVLLAIALACPLSMLFMMRHHRAPDNHDRHAKQSGVGSAHDETTSVR